MLDEAGGQVLVECSIGLFGEDGINAVRVESGEGAVRWDGDLERNKGSRVKFSFRRVETL